MKFFFCRITKKLFGSKELDPKFVIPYDVIPSIYVNLRFLFSKGENRAGKPILVKPSSRFFTEIWPPFPILCPRHFLIFQLVSIPVNVVYTDDKFSDD